MKKLLSIILTLVLLLSIVPMGAMTVSAATTVQTKINEINKKYPTGSYFSANGKACTHGQNGTCNNCRLSNICPKAVPTCTNAWTCLAFARYAFWYIFGLSPDAQPYQWATLDTINSIAKPGDFITFYNSSGSYYHAAIYLGPCSNGFYTYTSNYEKANKVQYNKACTSSNGYPDTQKYAKSKFKVFHARNYDTVNNSTPTNPTATVIITSQPDKNTITDTNAIVWGKVAKSTSAAVSKIGIKVRRDDSTYEKGWSRYDTPSKNYVGSSVMYPYYDMNAELKITLRHATKYYFKFYAKVDGKEYWSPEYYITTTGSHKYDNACDTTCNICGKTRSITHNYKWVIDKNANCGVNGSKHEECTVCGVKRNTNTVINATGKHTYDNACDTTCNTCGKTRSITHTYDSACDKTCNVCGEKRIITHNNKWVIEKNATCGSDGYKYAECVICGRKSAAKVLIPATNKHTYKKYKTTDATTSKNGKKYYECSVCGATKTSTIYKVSKVYLSTEEYTYNGKTKKPSVKVYDSKGKKLTEGEDYKISRPSSSKKVGKYKIKVTFKGDYTGTKTLYYTINPKGTKVSSVTAAKKSLKVKISKQSVQTTGYEIQYSTSKSFKSAKTEKVSSYKTTTVTLKSLKAKKTYYVRVRTYKTVDGKKYYSDWSNYRYKKTK